MRKRFIPFLLAILLLPMAMTAQTHYVIPIGEGTATSCYVPTYGYFNNSYAQMIYTANEIGIDGTIDTIAFNVDQNPATRTWTIYMAEVNQTDLTTLAPASAFQQVYQGSVSLAPGWVSIALDSAFAYQGTGSLAICVIDATGSYISDYSYFLGTEGTGDRSAYAYNDYTQFSLTSPPSVTRSNFIPSIRIGISSYSLYCRPPMQIHASNISSSGATISWDANGSTQWEVIVSDSAVTDLSAAAAYAVTTSSPSYTVTDLDGYTSYHVYVRAVCDGSSTSGWGYCTFRTHCTGFMSTPYSEGFENVETGALPVCWLPIVQGRSGAGLFPSVYNYATNARNGDGYLEFESTNGETEILALPAMDGISSLQLSFYAAVMNSNLTFEVGVMEDSVFVPVDTVELVPGSNNQWSRAYQYCSVSFVDYQGLGTRMAMRVSASAGYTLMLDDLIVTTASSCAMPTHFTATSPLANSATLKWHDTENYEWEILYDTMDFNPDSTDLLATIAYDTIIELTNLSSSHTYYAYLRANCGGEYNTWAGPVSFTPGRYVMGYAGSDTIQACSTTIYDNGGPEGEYLAYDNFTLVVYPSSEDSLVSLSGSTDIYSYYARLRIYDGVGTEGAVLWGSSTGTETFSNIRSTHGPVTIQFNAGSYAGGYDGFEINVSCIGAPRCPFVDGITPSHIASSSVRLSWQVSGLNLGTPSQFEIECYDTLGTLAGQTTSTTNSGIIAGLVPSTTYTAKVRAVCDYNEYGAWDSVQFTTHPLPCLSFDTSVADSMLISGATPQTTNYLPMYNYSNYSYTQQLILSNEMLTNAVINAIGFNYTGSSPDSTKNNCTIYLAHTAQSSLANSYVPFDSASFQMVYQGPFNMQPGWNRLDFIAPFHYDGNNNLVIAVVDNSGAYNYNNYYQSHSIRGRSRYISSYNSPVNIATATGNPTSYRNDIRFYTDGCSQSSSCSHPTLIIDSVTSSDIYLSWMPGYQETSWELSYRTADTSTWTTIGNVSTNQYHFAGLNADTRYVFRVTALCDDTNMSSDISYSTLCFSTPLPFVYGFEDFPGSNESSIPACWYKNTTYTYNSSYPYAVNTYSHSGSKSLYIYSSTGDHTYAVLPVLSAPVNQLELTLWAYNNSTYSTPTLSVGIMSDPEDFSTYTPLATIEPTTANQWLPFRISFSNYIGTARHIAMAMTDNQSGSVYVDDLSIDIIHSCPTATNVHATNIGSTSADIVWDSSDATEFIFEYGPEGFSHGSGTTTTVYNDHFINLTGLTPNTAYDVYVATLCGTDTASWSFLYSFRTNCILIDSLPYSTSFEVIPASWISDMSTNFYPCWTRVSDPNTSYQSVFISDSYSRTGTNAIYWNCSNYNTFFPSISLPEIDTNAISLDTLQLSFWAKRSTYTFNDNPQIVVGVMSNPTDITTFQSIDTITIPNSDDWAIYVIPLSGHTLAGHHVSLLATPGSSSWTAYIDDITIEPEAQCPFVGNLSASSASATSVFLSWTERGTASQYQVAFDTSASATPVPSITVYDTSATVTGLTPFARHYFWVRAVCSDDLQSEWVGPILAIPGSHNMVPNQTDTLYMCGGIIFDDGGASMSYTNSQDSYIILMPDTTEQLVSVTGMSQTEGIYHYFTIYDGIGTSGRTLYTDYGSYDTTTFGPIISTNGPLTLYLHSDNYYSPEYFGFEVNVSCISTYCRVTNIALDTNVATSSTTLALTWNGNQANSYQIEYGPQGFTQGTGTTIDVPGNSTIINGLMPSTNYDFYIRSLCGDSDTGVWASATFMTDLCDNASIAYSYDNSMTPTTTPYAPIGYSYYNYSYVQTLIDSAHLAGLAGDITAFAFNVTSTDAGNEFNNITIYMANVPESNLYTSFIMPDSNHTFVKVLDSANLSFTNTGWNIVTLDTSFAWDGHSNLLFAAKRDNGNYTDGAEFAAHSTSGYMTRYINQDSAPFSINDPNSASTSLAAVADLQLISCNNEPCPAPTITGITYDYESATITWSGTGSSYQVNIKEASALTWPSPDMTTTGNTYTFNSLLPSTNYTFRVRQDCSADSLGYSEWTIDGFTTDSLNCLFPSNLTISDITNNAATFEWTPAGSETMWELHIWFTGGLDSIYTVSTHPVTLGGFSAGITYNATIRALCGTAHNIEGDWSPIYSFTGATCPGVSELAASNVTTNSVTLNWASNPMANSWIIEYGYRGFNIGTGTTTTTTSNSITINALECETEYDFYVKAVCGTDWSSENWSNVAITTAECTEFCNAPRDVTTTVNGNSVDVTWTPSEENSSFEIEYGASGFSHGTGTTITASEPHATISGLDYNTQYDLYVRAICGTENYSAWSNVSTFTTQPLGINNANEASCTIYPNPTTASTSISVNGANGQVKIEVVDMNGHTVASETLECASDCIKTMDVRQLAQGAYFVRITGQRTNIVKKLIVK